MKEQLFSTLKQSVEILQNDMTKEDEPVWLGTLWNVDASLAKMAEKYLANEKQKQFELLDTIAVENDKKNQRIKELEEKSEKLIYECFKKFPNVKIPDDADFYHAIHDLKQLLNQKP